MANEITMQVLLSTTKANGALSPGTLTGQVSQTNIPNIDSTISIGTTAEQLDFGDISGAPAAFEMKNLDTTNFVQVALDSGVSTQIFAKLLPGAVMLIPPATGTIYAKADTAACFVKLVAISA